jgi:hypothetical protein
MPTVPLRADGWPDWLGRRPMASADRAEIRRRVEADLPQGPLTDPGSLLCYLTIDGLDHTDNSRAAIRLRGQIHAAIRSATEDRLTTYHTTESTITIGIHGHDAQERINQLRNALGKLLAKNRLALHEFPR